MTGRSQPTTAGACTSAETSKRTGRETLTRDLRLLSVCCHSGGAGRTSVEPMRAANAQPHSKRIQNTMAPASQMATIQGKNFVGGAPVSGRYIGAAAETVEAVKGTRLMRPVGTEIGSDGPIRLHVTSGAAVMAASATQARMYRVFERADAANHLRAEAYRAAISTPCQRKWTRVQPRRSTHGCDEKNCMGFRRTALSLSQMSPAFCGYPPVHRWKRAGPRERP
jgi:hypothetical protein